MSKEEQELYEYWDRDNWKDYMTELKYYRNLCGDSYRLTHKPKKSKLVFNIGKRKIVLSKETKTKLRKLKKKKQSYDDVIVELQSHYVPKMPSTSSSEDI